MLREGGKEQNKVSKAAKFEMTIAEQNVCR